MNPILIVLIVALSLALLVLLLGLFMIAPGQKKRQMQRYAKVKYAHRGLHDATRAENSMSAFRAAKEHGFGIELDVRLSKDGELVVFHDDDLKRMTGVDGKVNEYTKDELAKMSLLGTEDGVPTLREVLELIDGAVPLLIEIKSKNGKEGTAEKLVEVIKDYKGEFIVESFNPLSLRVIKKARPDVLRGILSMEYTKDERYKGKTIFTLSEKLLLNFLMRPNFVAYEKNGYAVKNVRLIRRSFGTPLIAWTIKSLEEEKEAISRGFDTVIFEGYLPEK